MSDATATATLIWRDLSSEVRAALTGRLAGLWDWPTDETCFDALAVDKQQALLLFVRRLSQLRLWSVVRKVTNVYGVNGVGLAFDAWPVVASTLRRRKDFTRRFARHGDTSGGFYELGRGAGVLHFLYVDKPGQPRRWEVHFDLYSPVHTPASLVRHIRYEFLGRALPDWRAIKAALADTV
jgi:hypothetical protein